MRSIRFVFIWIFLLTFLFLPEAVFAICNSASECSQQIQDLENKIANTQKQSQTLSSAIAYLNLKQALAQRQIDATQFQIQLLQRDIESLGGKITLLEGSLNTLTASLLRNVVTSYKHRSVDDLSTLFASRNFADALSAYKYLVIAQRYRQDMLLRTTQTKFEYDQEKSTKEKKQQEIASLKKQYERQKLDLEDQRRAKQALLAQTKNSEANYQSLLADAQAQLQAFRKYVRARGGASILANQTVCNDWGCYYNQRDSSWGNLPLGSSNESVAESGCLISSIAMISTHYGKKINPKDIANTNSAFAYGKNNEPLLWDDVTINGIRMVRTRYDYPSTSTIDNALSGGKPVIVGLRGTARAPEHFIVLKSGSGGNYIMNDPFEVNGHDISFTSVHKISDIKRLDKVSVF